MRPSDLSFLMVSATGADGASACSTSQRAQEMVLRTHSGDCAGLACLLLISVSSCSGISPKSILSQRTNASSCCTRMRGLVPTCASRIREAARARWASGVAPFLSRSSVFNARGRSETSQAIYISTKKYIPSSGIITTSSRPSRHHFLSW